MKKLLTIALAALFAVCAAEAKTYYVNASRPNNNGNGLKPKTAKKTIQAAINIAKKGDTILVYPGKYAPIKTNDKKITIKAIKGASKTTILKPAKEQKLALAQLGKTYTIRSTSGTQSSAPLAKGSNTLLNGFLLDGMNRSNGYYDLIGISGGKATSCCIQRLGHTTVVTTGGSTYSYNDSATAAANAHLVACVLKSNKYLTTGTGLISGCTLQRCRIQTNAGLGWGEAATLSSCHLYNCLLTKNSSDGPLFSSSALVNCTVADNSIVHTEETTKFSKNSKYWNCILKDNTSQWKETKWVEIESATGSNWEQQTVEHRVEVHNVDSGNTYSKTYKDNRNPKFVNADKGDYRLRKGSPCINQGKLTAAQKKKLGSLDLAGAKRIRGKVVDMGCYEY